MALGTTDIFSLFDERSLVRSAFQGTVLLQESDLPTFRLDNSYVTIDVTIEKDEDTLDHLEKIVEICKESRHTGKQEKLQGAIYEAFRNAYQHGNRKDPAKKIRLSHKVGKNSFEVIVSDEGGELNAHFVPFVLLHRQQRLTSPISFYNFAPGVPKSPENSGIGTYVMHSVADRIHYFKNTAGGLSVQMIIYGPQLSLNL